MYIGTGAKPPQPTIQVVRGRSTLRRPLTDIARRVWERAHPDLSHDLTTLKLIPFSTIHQKLLELNPRMYFIEIGDGRIGIGVETPSAAHIAAYESLSYYDRKEADSHKEVKGPRVLLICASRNAVDPYTELMSISPCRVVARSLRTIIRACVEGGAFTWEAAEQKFGMPFKNAKVTVRQVPFTPTAWHARKDSRLVVASS